MLYVLYDLEINIFTIKLAKWNKIFLKLQYD